MIEKKSKKKMTNDGQLNQYIFDDEEENIGKELFCFILKFESFVYI